MLFHCCHYYLCSLSPTLVVLSVATESVTIRYSAVNTIPVCKRVEFTVNPSVVQRQHAKVLLTLRTGTCGIQ